MENYRTWAQRHGYSGVMVQKSVSLRLKSVDYSVCADIELGDLLAGSLVHRSLADPDYLAYNLQLAGNIRLADTAAHHIVAGGDRRAEVARDILAEYNIDINDPINGIFLPSTKNSKAPGAYHPGLHTDRYYQNVNDILERSVQFGEAGVRSALQSIKNQLLTDTFCY